MNKLIPISLLLIFLLSACAMQPYGLLYTQVTQGVAYPRPWVHGELDLKKITLVGPAHGEACSTNFLGLVATGNGGIDSAVQDALKRAGSATILYDVRIDRSTKTYFGLYSKFCTEVSGTAAK
ncbi:MAG: TRL domain-containing protein [Leptospirillum sp.]